MIDAFFSKYSCRDVPLISWLMMIALAAVRTWQTVSSGFFPPIFLVNLGQKHQAHRAYHQMSFYRRIIPHLEVIQADLRLVILEAPFHCKPGESYSKQFPPRR